MEISISCAYSISPEEQMGPCKLTVSTLSLCLALVSFPYAFWKQEGENKSMHVWVSFNGTKPIFCLCSCARCWKYLFCWRFVLCCCGVQCTCCAVTFAKNYLSERLFFYQLWNIAQKNPCSWASLIRKAAWAAGACLDQYKRSKLGSRLVSLSPLEVVTFFNR